MHLDERERTRADIRTIYNEYSAHSNIVPVPCGNGTNELWYTTPYDSQPNDTSNISMVLYVKTTKKECQKHAEVTEIRKKSPNI